MCQQGKGQRLQGVAREYRFGFAKRFVTRRFAASQVIVVHGRQIIVDQGIGVHALDRAGSDIQRLVSSAQGAPGRVYQQRANTFATLQHGITHGLVQL